MGEFLLSPPVIIMFRVGEDIGHYDCLYLEQQHVMVTANTYMYISVKHISPIPVNNKMQAKEKEKKKVLLTIIKL